ncbi:putative 2OG-Fe(II) oxygenase superfamily protein [Lyophyllum shimeji]|uniref:2OG-Fe(II) oxygenase superfamily protein n=1 Tax=Lyophyllum shimeji TaxID=47721 RepID=A0A9P3UNB9_LYOSH|nr:putative 2OG-Fe(II) oxygenase superfamily protein [Lyophyllum shimeji]
MERAEQRDSLPDTELPPKQPELDARFIPDNDSGAADPRVLSDSLRGPLVERQPSVEHARYTCPVRCPQSAAVERSMSCTTVSTPRIVNDLCVEPSTQIPTPRQIPISVPTNLVLQEKYAEPDVLMYLLTEKLKHTTLYCAEQNPSLHEFDVFSQNKPPLPALPPLWAQSRQEVCESFDWFRSYQGGVYHVRDHAKGYLLSAFSSSRDLFEHDGRLIISHGGGKAESIHSCQGRSMIQAADDQLAQDKSVRALLTNYRQSRPLVLLIDEKYALFPYDLRAKGVVYAVLGLYTISHVWAEYQPANNPLGRVVRYKFAFQWCEGQGEPWWIPHKTEATAEEAQLLSSRTTTTATILPSPRLPAKIRERKLRDTMPPKPDPIYLTCIACSQKTPKVYELGWACLNPNCNLFWITPEHGYLPLHLNYNRAFLRLSSPYMLPANLRDIRPGTPKSSRDGITTTYPFTRGLHCKNCGRLSCRVNWAYWKCPTPDCPTRVEAVGRLRHAKEFWNEKLPVSFSNHCIHAFSEITKETPKLFRHAHGLGQIQTFILPSGKGRIHHIRTITPEGKRAADMIFREYQEHASLGRLLFRRWPMRAHKCRGPLLTNYFSQNSGEPYQYVGGTDNTVPFSETSSAVMKARDLIQQRIHQALGMRSEFNEVLSAAYMERQKMAFHSDSERGLGPLVAGLSLGAPALMHFRMHHKHQGEDEIERKGILLTIVLRHGDVLVMDGAGVQEHYEHTVVPTNFRIAATARKIDLQPRKVKDVTMALPTKSNPSSGSNTYPVYCTGK